MKTCSLLIILMIAFSCNRNTSKPNLTIESQAEKNNVSTCEASDIFALQEKSNEELFFRQLDSKIKTQYPVIDEKLSAEITPALLTEFLKELNLENLENNAGYQKKIPIKLTPAKLKTKIETNTIELIFFPQECSYRLSILTYYETDEFSDENSVSYSFKILNNKITDFERQEAG